MKLIAKNGAGFSCQEYDDDPQTLYIKTQFAVSRKSFRALEVQEDAPIEALDSETLREYSDEQIFKGFRRAGMSWFQRLVDSVLGLS